MILQKLSLLFSTGKLLLPVPFLLTSAMGQESIESQLAPNASTPEAEIPALPIEVIDPSPHLPSFPTWLILLSALLILAPIALIVIAILKNRSHSIIPSGRLNPSAIAWEKLTNLRKLPPQTPLSEIATHISLAIRQYLTDSRLDSSLYQTREEFLTDEDHLAHLENPGKEKTAELLTELASLQYAPPTSDAAQTEMLIEKSLKTLDTLARPKPTSPAADV